jgi:hypothetical protein
MLGFHLEHPTMDLRHLDREAQQYGASVDSNTQRSGFVNVDAPNGKVWSASGTHALCVQFEDAGHRASRAMMHDAVTDALERMALGLDDCDDPECDICHA